MVDGIEQVAGVGQFEPEPVRADLGEQAQIELRGRQVDLLQLQHEAGRAWPIGQFGEGEHDLEHRAATGVARHTERVDQLRKRQILMCVGRNGCLLYLLQQLFEAGISRPGQP